MLLRGWDSYHCGTSNDGRGRLFPFLLAHHHRSHCYTHVNGTNVYETLLFPFIQSFTPPQLFRSSLGLPGHNTHQYLHSAQINWGVDGSPMSELSVLNVIHSNTWAYCEVAHWIPFVESFCKPVLSLFLYSSYSDSNFKSYIIYNFHCACITSQLLSNLSQPSISSFCHPVLIAYLECNFSHVYIGVSAKYVWILTQYAG
jgi:hypothetical protein